MRLLAGRPRTSIAQINYDDYPPATAGGTDLLSAGGTDLSYRRWHAPAQSPMWNDTDIPLGYLISFRTYGTWLHGDDRGSTDRFHNAFGGPHLGPNEPWRRHNQNQLHTPPLLLSAEQRRSVEKGIRETCDYRRWHLRALNVRTNHIHVVLSIGITPPARALNALKANATRQMRQDGYWKKNHSPWSDKGSQKYLWTAQSLSDAVNYVLNRQGGDLKT